MSQSRVMQLVEQISQAIIDGELAPGTRLDEAGLAARFGTSRTPIREALAEICARGLAERQPYRGVAVTVPDRAVLLDRFEALAEIEALCAGLAAHRASMDDMLAIEDDLLQMETAAPESYRQANFAFHDRVCAMARNSELSRMVEGLRLRLEAVRRAQLSRSDRQRRSQQEHRELVTALCDRDAERAASVMRNHLRAAAREAVDLIERLYG